MTVVEIRKNPTAGGSFPVIKLSKIPVQMDDDYQCEYPDLLTFDQVKRISYEILHGNCIGEIDGFTWWTS